MSTNRTRGHWPGQRGDRDRGQALVELAVTLPILLLVLLLTVDFARLFFMHVGVTNAAREGAAYGAQCLNPGPSPCPTTSEITFVARQEVGGDPALTVAVACNASCAPSMTLPGNTIRVTTTRIFTPIFGVVVPTVTLTAEVTAVIQ